MHEMTAHGKLPLEDEQQPVEKRAVSALAAVLGVASQEFVVSEHYNPGKTGSDCHCSGKGSGYVPMVKVGPIGS